MADRFSRFNEDRSYQGGNHFDQYEDGQLELEQASLDKPIESDNIGHKLLQKHGWKLGQGLGKTMQGRTDPVPIIVKYDVMGMGRMEMEMDYAEDATEKRRVLEIEKEDTEELRQKYKDYAEKEKAIAKALEDLRANFYCELCDKQYQKHQEFDNHINSYDHAHKQRLKELKQREFARNVSSRSRKDERKQEKMLRRLHELAEKRKQPDRTPGSGPMFKALTVAADDDTSEPAAPKSDGESLMDCLSEGMLGEDTMLSASGQMTTAVSPKQTSTISFSLGKKISSPTPAVALPKVSVSFSLAKKAPVKLETAAAVFADQGEEALEEEGQEEEVSASNRDSLSGGQTEEQQSTQVQPDEGGSLASTLSKLKMMMKKDEAFSGQGPQYYHYVPPAHCRVKPNFQFLLFMKASEQTGGNEEEEEEAISEQKQCKATEKSEKESEETQKAPNTEPSATLSNVKVEDGSCGSLRVSALSEKGHTDSSQGAGEPTQGSRLPAGAFFSVLSKDENTMLQWPSELQEFTRTQPSLSYSCNPLYFDFKLSRNKGARCGRVADTSKTNTEAIAESRKEVAPAAGRRQTPGPSVERKGSLSLKEEGTDGLKDEQKLRNSTDPAKKKKKKKKKHKKSGKHSKHDEKDKGAAEGVEVVTPGGNAKKKKHKCKKSKSRALAEVEGRGVDKDHESADAQTSAETGAGKRKRPIKEESQKFGSGGNGHEKACSSEEHNGKKRYKLDPGTVVPPSTTTTINTSSSTSAQKRSSSRGRRGNQRPSSESEDDGDSSSLHSHRRRSTPRQERRHRSKNSRSRSSRRGSQHSRSYSTSSAHSSRGSSPYSRRSHSFSDSYSDYSSESRRRSKRSSDSEYGKRGGSGQRRSHRRHYSSSSSEDSSRSRSRSHRHRRRRSRHRSRSSSSGSSSSRHSWRRSSYSRSRSSASRSSTSTKGSSRRRHRDSLTHHREFNHSRIYRSQSPRSSLIRAQGRKESSHNSTHGHSTTSSTEQKTSGAGASTGDRPARDQKNSLTARQLLEKVQSRKGSEDSVAGAKAGTKLKDPPQGYFGPKLPPALGSKSVLPLFGKLPAGKKQTLSALRRPEEEEKVPTTEGVEAGSEEAVLVEPIREFPPLPPPPPQPQQLKDNLQSTTIPEEMQHQTSEEQATVEQDQEMLVEAYQGEPVLEASNSVLEPLMSDIEQQHHATQHQQALLPYPQYQASSLDGEDMGLEAEDDDALAPLESQPITFTPEEMEKYSKLQQAAQQHIQQQLLAKQVKTFPSAAVAVAAAANMTPAPPPPALQQIHIQQPAVSAAGASITTVQHALLQHHAAATAAAIGIHPHHPHAQLAQVHHIPQPHLTPISLSPLAPTLGPSIGHSLGHAGLIPAHPTAFLSGQPIHIIPASALHHTPLALHHVPHTALYPTLLTPRPAAAAALQLHPLLHPIFSAQDLQHPPGHGS
ncbi:G patch domain-containing protein 8-like isoform X1 [Scleropages formosus]|nr:G patch domain-containing protein 8-like isoform X1 [Scleropages formosus]